MQLSKQMLCWLMAVPDNPVLALYLGALATSIAEVRVPPYQPSEITLSTLCYVSVVIFNGIMYVNWSLYI